MQQPGGGAASRAMYRETERPTEPQAVHHAVHAGKCQVVREYNPSAGAAMSTARARSEDEASPPARVDLSDRGVSVASAQCHRDAAGAPSRQLGTDLSS